MLAAALARACVVGALLSRAHRMLLHAAQRGYEARLGASRRDTAAAALADVLRRNPSHPGALHYTVHLFDTPRWAETPAAHRAAARYGSQLPTIPHAVHMVSHLQLRAGDWAAAAEANELAQACAAQLQALDSMASDDDDDDDDEEEEGEPGKQAGKRVPGAGHAVRLDWHNHEFLHYVLLQVAFACCGVLLQLLLPPPPPSPPPPPRALPP